MSALGKLAGDAGLLCLSARRTAQASRLRCLRSARREILQGSIALGRVRAAAPNKKNMDDSHLALDDDDEEPAPALDKEEARKAPPPSDVIVPSVSKDVQNDTVDDFDDYGNVVPASALVGNNSRKRKHATIPAQPPEPWANPPDTLPIQQFSFVGMASLDVDQRSVALTLPQDVGEVDPAVVARVLAQLGIDSPNPKTPLQVAHSPQTRLHQDGHSAANLLTAVSYTHLTLPTTAIV